MTEPDEPGSTTSVNTLPDPLPLVIEPEKVELVLVSLPIVSVTELVAVPLLMVVNRPPLSVAMVRLPPLKERVEPVDIVTEFRVWLAWLLAPRFRSSVPPPERTTLPPAGMRHGQRPIARGRR